MSSDPIGSTCAISFEKLTSSQKKPRLYNFAKLPDLNPNFVHHANFPSYGPASQRNSSQTPNPIPIPCLMSN